MGTNRKIILWSSLTGVLVGYFIFHPLIMLLSYLMTVRDPALDMTKPVGIIAVFLIYFRFIFGFFMRKADIPIGPMILGVVLGNMLDQNFRRAMVLFEDESIWQVLIDRPMGSILILIVLITFISGIWPKKKKPHKQKI